VATAWREVAASVNVGVLDRVAARLLPLDWSNLRRHGIEVTELATRYRETRQANARLLDQLGDRLLPLREAGIPTVLLRGSALLAEGPVDLDERPVADLDILVPLDRAVCAARVLEGRASSETLRLMAQFPSHVSWVRGDDHPYRDHEGTWCYRPRRLQRDVVGVVASHQRLVDRALRLDGLKRAPRAELLAVILR